jgi:hypothetical protein
VSDFPQTWVTNENPPRKLIVKGVALVDPDCLVAHFEGERKAYWLIEHSGYVVGLKSDKPVHATRAPAKGGET